MIAWRERGVLAALGAALLFGAGTPAAKLLLGRSARGCWRGCSTWVPASAWR